MTETNGQIFKALCKLLDRLSDAQIQNVASRSGIRITKVHPAYIDPSIDPKQELASGPGLAARFAALGGQSAASGEAVLAAAAANDPAAQEVVRNAAERLGVLIGLLVNALDPEVVIIGGGLGLAGGLYGSRLTASIRAHIWAESRRQLPILPAALGSDAGVIGAALTVARKARARPG